jgi:subfamily B ATP-binding cassette protein MsbA
MSKISSGFGRLLPYAARYRWRLTVGVLAGVAVGGSLFGLLTLSPELIAPFEHGQVKGPESGVTPAAPLQAKPQPATLGSLGSLAARLGVETTTADGSMTWQFLLLTLCGLPLLILLKELATYLNHYYMRWAGARVVMDLRNDLFSTLQRQSLKYFGKCDIGELISRCVNDTAIIETSISNTIADLARAPVEILAASGFILYFAVRNDLLAFVVALFVGFPLCVLPVVLLGHYVKRYTLRALDRISVLVSRMQENFTGIRVVKAFHTEAEEETRFVDLNRRYFRDVVKALRAELLMTPLMEAVALVFAVVFVVFCYAKHVKLSEVMPLGLAAITAYRPVKQLAKLNANLQRCVAAVERVFVILDTDTSLPEAANPTRLLTFADRVRFEGVSFRYEASGPAVLSGISFDIPKGSVVAFVGETGVGKTTVANLLARFYDPSEGRVTLDGLDLRQVEVASLRRLIGVVTQETILFNDTIANNIAYGSADASREQITEAARKANAHDFIVAEPEGYERVVGDKGFRLSGGQRQRIAIARAILRNPPILILDEATSSLDTVTEQLVQEAIARVMADRTVFAIAHRLSTIKHASLICLLENGRITERGTHAELYAGGGRYRRLCDLQFS